MSHPITLCVDITGNTFTALLHLRYGGGGGPQVQGLVAGNGGPAETNEYTMTGSGTVGGPAVSLTVKESPCGGQPGQPWTCEIPSADAAGASYILQGGEEGAPRTGTIGSGQCGIPKPLPPCPAAA